MDRYTEILDIEASNLSPDDDQYELKLLNIASLFRSFPDALTQFICTHGYSGSSTDIAAKTDFLKTQYKANAVPVPRDLQDWFAPGKSIKRETAFQLCFALALTVDETNDFFKRVIFERSFDCHSIAEAVYYFCIRNNKPFSEAKKLISLMPKVNNKGKVDTETSTILYTGTIIDFINGISDSSELITFVNEHITQFGYNNATATKHIQTLWHEISGDRGLAYLEGCILSNAYEYRANSHDEKITTADADSDSVWRIYCQILGLDNHQTAQYGENRSIKPMIEENHLLPALAEASFPDRDGIEKIIRGNHVSHERIRKLMILLDFYSYWAGLIVKANDACFEASPFDAERYLAKTDRYLLESGYPSLYQGNPYDWIFMWAIKDPNPLLAFREHITELFAYKGDSLLQDNASDELQ